MPDIDSTTVPGTVSIPTWLFIVAFISQFGLIVWLVKSKFSDIERLLVALNASTAATIAGTSATNALVAEVRAWAARKP